MQHREGLLIERMKFIEQAIFDDDCPNTPETVRAIRVAFRERDEGKKFGQSKGAGSGRGQIREFRVLSFPPSPASLNPVK